MVTITHRIDEELKERLDLYCEEHGLKVQAVVREAIAQWLEDAEDLALVEERRRGPWIAWEEVRDEIKSSASRGRSQGARAASGKGASPGQIHDRRPRR